MTGWCNDPTDPPRQSAGAGPARRKDDVYATLERPTVPFVLPASGNTKLHITVGGPADDEERFAEFVRSSSGQLARTAYLLTGNRAAAEDLVQETVLRLYRRQAWLLGADAPVAYARRTMTNVYINERRRKASTELVTDAVPDLGVEPDLAGVLADRDQVWTLLRALPAKQRAAIVLRYYHDLSDADIAVALECREGTVRSLISRGLATLRVAPDDRPATGGGPR